MTRLWWCCWLAGYALALDMTARELQAVAKVDKEKENLWGRHVILIHVISWFPMLKSKLHLCYLMARKLLWIHAPMFIDQGGTSMHLQVGCLMWECNLIEFIICLLSWRWMFGWLVPMYFCSKRGFHGHWLKDMTPSHRLVTLYVCPFPSNRPSLCSYYLSMCYILLPFTFPL